MVDADDGRVLGTGEIGELCFRSPQVVDGYWNDEDATRASFVAKRSSSTSSGRPIA